MIVVQYNEEGRKVPWDGNKVCSMFALVKPLQTPVRFHTHIRYVKDGGYDFTTSSNWFDPRSFYLQSFKLELVY